MRSLTTVIVLAGALALGACSKPAAVDEANTSAAAMTETNEAVAATNAADTNVADANAAASGLEGTGNPIGPGAPASGGTGQ